MLLRHFYRFYTTLKLNYRHPIIKTQIFCILFYLPGFLSLDSPWFNQQFSYGQWIADYITVWVYIWIYSFAYRRMRIIMTITVVAGLGAEFLASVLCKFYTYRLDRIPIYVPFGHAVVYAITKHMRSQLQNPFLIKNLKRWLPKIAFLLCVYSLLIAQDVVGLVLFLLFIVLLINRKDKLMYWICFFVCYYLEILGTRLHVWTWYGVVGNHPRFPPIANPPSGIGIAYLVLHMCSMRIYLFYRKRKIKKSTITIYAS